MSAPVKATPTPPHGVSVIAVRLIPPPGRHRIDPSNPRQWLASTLVGDRRVKAVQR